MKILLELAFVGSSYCGWQSQKKGDSVQEKLTLAASTLFGVSCDVTGCSRTDSGVHANGFCAVISEKQKNSLCTTIPLLNIPRAINAFLPDDISVFRATEVHDDFHPRYSVKYKEYVYLIHTCPERNAFLSQRVWHYPKKLNVELMNEGAKFFLGRHKFDSFMAAGSKIVDTERNVVTASVASEGDIITFRVGADGFLYNMVRIMTGTLIEVGLAKIKPYEIEQIIKKLDRKSAGITAPACGLYLDKVYY